MDFTSRIFPRTKEQENQMHFPLGICLHPLQIEKPISLVNIETDLQKCPLCGKYLISYNNIHNVSQEPICLFHKYPFDIQLVYNQIINQIPKCYEWKSHKVNIKTMVLIDSSYVSFKSGFLQKVLFSLSKSIPNNYTNISFATLSTCMTFIHSKDDRLLCVQDIDSKILLSDSIFFQTIPSENKIQLLSKSFSKPSIKLLQGIKIAKNLVGKKGRIFILLSSQPYGFKDNGSTMELTPLTSGNYTSEWKNLEKELVSDEICCNFLIHNPISSFISIDEIALSNLVKATNGFLEMMNSTQFYEIDRIINKFFHSLPLSIQLIYNSRVYIQNGIKNKENNNITFLNHSCNSNDSIYIPLNLLKELSPKILTFQLVTTYIDIDCFQKTRVFEQYIDSCDNLIKIYQYANLNCITKYFIYETLNNFQKNNCSISNLMETAGFKISEIFSYYMTNFQNYSLTLKENGFIIPITLKFLPYYVYNFLKSPAFCYGTSQNERNYYISKLSVIHPSMIPRVCNPSLRNILPFITGQISNEASLLSIPLTKSRLEDGQIYLFIDYFMCWIYFTKNINSDFLQVLLGKDIQNVYNIFQQNNIESNRLFSLVHGQINIAIENNFGYILFQDRLIEDKSTFLPQFQDFLKLIQKDTKEILRGFF